MFNISLFHYRIFKVATEIIKKYPEIDMDKKWVLFTVFGQFGIERKAEILAVDAAIGMDTEKICLAAGVILKEHFASPGDF